MSCSRRLLLRAIAGVGSAHALSALAQSSSSTAAGAPTRNAAPALRPRNTWGTGSTRVALLLEASGGPFGKASAPVLAGIRAAHSREAQAAALELYEVNETDDVSVLLRELARRQVSIAIGPLTRRAVNTLADRAGLPMPVIALNQPDADRTVPRGMVVFGLPIEAEARQVARAAFDEASALDGVRKPLRAAQVVYPTPVARRSAAAFAEVWQQRGGVLTAVVETDARSPGELRNALSDIGLAEGDALFAAVDADGVRAVRSALPRQILVYGTSQLNASFGGPAPRPEELEGVRIVEMPWQLAQDAGATMGYPKPPSAMAHRELQRLYALGIDAYRVASEVLAGRTSFELDGVTGRLRADLGSDARIERASLLAEFRGGSLVPRGTP